MNLIKVFLFIVFSKNAAIRRYKKIKLEPNNNNKGSVDNEEAHSVLEDNENDFSSSRSTFISDSSYETKTFDDSDHDKQNITCVNDKDACLQEQSICIESDNLCPLKLYELAFAPIQSNFYFIINKCVKSRLNNQIRNSNYMSSETVIISFIKFLDCEFIFQNVKEINQLQYKVMMEFNEQIEQFMEIFKLILNQLETQQKNLFTNFKNFGRSHIDNKYEMVFNKKYIVDFINQITNYYTDTDFYNDILFILGSGYDKQDFSHIRVVFVLMNIMRAKKELNQLHCRIDKKNKIILKKENKKNKICEEMSCYTFLIFFLNYSFTHYKEIEMIHIAKYFNCCIKVFLDFNKNLSVKLKTEIDGFCEYVLENSKNKNICTTKTIRNFEDFSINFLQEQLLNFRKLKLK